MYDLRYTMHEERIVSSSVNQSTAKVDVSRRQITIESNQLSIFNSHYSILNGCSLANQFIAVATYIDDLQGFIPFQFFTEFGNEHIHTTGVKEVVFAP